MPVVATELGARRGVFRLMRPIAALIAVTAFAGFAASLTPARAAVADDPTGAGPYTAVRADYKLPATFDTLVTKQLARKTELWARMWYPTKGPELKNAPIVVFLHGEHGTCGKVDPTGKWRLDGSRQYSTDGICTGEYPIVTPNNVGYDYIAQRLATQGYVTISINTNLGINQMGMFEADPDPFLIIRRGRMILRHLMQVGRWNSGLDTSNKPGFFDDFRGKLDFSKISLVGHSRGGDAIVNAYFQLVGDTDGWKSRLPSNAKIVSLAAIAPTDKAVQQNVASQIPMDGAAYGVLLPMCDGDVDRLEGIRFYDRAVGYFPDDGGNFRAVMTVNGAGHNGFNTEWHTQDNYSLGGANQPTTQKCLGQGQLFPKIGTVPDQQEIARYFVMSMVRAKTKGGSWAELLNPAYDLPKTLTKITDYDRSYFPATDIGANRLLARFSAATPGNCANVLYGYAGVTAKCTNAPEHFFDYNNHSNPYNVWGARILWGPPANKKKPEDGLFWAFVTMYNGASPQNISKMKSIEMRIGPDCRLFSSPDNADEDTVPELACSGWTQQSLFELGTQHIGVQFVDTNQKYSNRHFVLLKDYIRERQAVGLEQDKGTLPINPNYHALLSSVRIPITAFTKNADKGFNLSKIAGMYLLLSPKSKEKGNKTGGLYIGDIWATQNPPTSMKFDEKTGASELSAAADSDAGPILRAPSLAGFTPATAEITPQSETEPVQVAADSASVSADVGARLVDAVRKPAPAGGQSGGSGVIELTVSTRGDMVENSSGFRVVLGGKAASGIRIDRGPAANPSETTISVPAALVDNAPDGAALSVGSGGSTWRFGSLSKSAVR